MSRAFFPSGFDKVSEAFLFRLGVAAGVVVSVAFDVESLVGAACANDDVAGVELAVTVADGSCPAPVLIELSTELRNWHWSARRV